MADEADAATDFNDLMVSRALGRMRQEGPVKPGAKFCAECEDPIPEPRRKLGFALCVECAEEAERRSALYANY